MPLSVASSIIPKYKLFKHSSSVKSHFLLNFSTEKEESVKNQFNMIFYLFICTQRTSTTHRKKYNKSKVHRYNQRDTMDCISLLGYTFSTLKHYDSKLFYRYYFGQVENNFNTSSSGD